MKNPKYRFCNSE